MRKAVSALTCASGFMKTMQARTRSERRLSEEFCFSIGPLSDIPGGFARLSTFPAAVASSFRPLGFVAFPGR